MFTRRAVSAFSRAQAGARCYATSSSQVKPPISLFGIDGTYASALYSAAAKSSALEPTAKALDNLSALFKKDPKLDTVLSAPTLSAESKQTIIAEIQKQAGAEKSPVFKNFLETLAENNRLGALNGVCDKFAQLMSAHRGEVELVITSAVALDARSLRQLEQAASKSEFVGQGQKLKVVANVDPEIKGGLLVEIGDRTIDLSVSSKVTKMNKLLRDSL